MSGNPIAVKSGRGRLVLFSALIFFAGMIMGVLLGVFGIRYLFFHRPPNPENLAKKAVSLIDEDFSLDASTRKAIEKECLLYFSDVEKTFVGTRNAIENTLKEHADNIAQIFPEGETRRKWLDNYRKYFPKGPPPRSSPPPLPPPSSE